MLQATRVFQCLGDETRLRAMLLVHQCGELCVCDLVEALGDSQPKVSRHLALLRNCGLLCDQRRGQWVFYSLPSDLPDWVRGVLTQAAAVEARPLAQMVSRLGGSMDRPQRCAAPTVQGVVGS